MAGDLRYLTGQRPYGQGPVKIPCISGTHDDSSPSMAIYPDHCFCYACRRHWTAEQFLAAVGRDGADLPALTAVAKQPYQVDPKLEGQVQAWHQTLTNPSSPRYDRITWLQEKYGLWPETIAGAQLGHTGTRFSIPIRTTTTSATALLGIKYRLDPLYNDSETLRQMKYSMPPGQPTLLYRPNPSGQTTIICEGEFDALALAQIGYDAVTITTGAGGLGRLRALEPGLARSHGLYCATDLDAAGDTAYHTLSALWPNGLPRVRFPSATDVCDALAALPAWRRASAVERWLRDAVVEDDTWV